MRVRPIRNDADHAHAMVTIEELWGAEQGTDEADLLEIFLTLVNAYEAEHHVIDPPDPIDALVFRVEQAGLSRKDLEPYIGSRARVSEILNRRRTLTLAMIRRLRDGLGISADVLLGEDEQRASA